VSAQVAGFSLSRKEYVKRISLSGGRAFALVDDADFEFLSQFKWYFVDGYAVTNVKMHKLLLNAPAEQIVDHINRVRLDNQRQNLRIATKSQNAQNMAPRVGSATGIKGVGPNWTVWTKRDGTVIKRAYGWRVQICKDGKDYRFPVMRNLRAASLLYDMAAIDLFGPYAVTNNKVVLSGP
jgi:hypothetical protein